MNYFMTLDAKTYEFITLLISKEHRLYHCQGKVTINKLNWMMMKENVVAHAPTRLLNDLNLILTIL